MEEKNVQTEKRKLQELSEKEYELIKQLVQTRVEAGANLVYEELEGYEVPPRTQFSMTKKPAVSIKNGMLNFNMACIRLFEGVQYIVPMVSESGRKIAVVPCSEEERASIDWARKKDDKWVNKSVRNIELVTKVITFMKWDVECRYKVMGEIRMSPRGPILVFELDEAIMFAAKKEEYLDEESGEVKSKRAEIKFYPDKYRGKIGMSYSDYMETKQLNMFEDFAEYFDQGKSGGQDEGRGGTEIV